MTLPAPDTDNFTPLGVNLFGDPIEPDNHGEIKGRFIIPPFSVLNARDGDWQERKRGWLSLGIQSEVGRDDDLLGNRGGAASCERYDGRERNTAGSSIFDPTLCELAYTWFCPPGGQVVDPFAGGSVRGIVAHKLGYRYWGCELRSEQVEANAEQGKEITPTDPPVWVCGDALDAVPNAPAADFVFSCPPYGDLECYSDDPRDLSAMEYQTFLATYKRIILRTCAKLKQDRFAFFVVADFRDRRTGNYRDFVSATIAAFVEQGLHLYNEAILVTAVGSLPIRITKQFEAGRKLGKTHQNVLVFVKGDGKRAAKAIQENAT